jgi:YHS domain-containing protein
MADSWRVRNPKKSNAKTAIHAIERRCTMKHHAGELRFEDPVCGMEVSRSTAADEVEYQGKRFYFCAASCREAFEAEPEKYLRKHRQRGQKPA